MAAVRELDQLLAVLGETFLLRDGKGAAAEGESSNRGESHGEKAFFFLGRVVLLLQRGNNEFQSHSQKEIGC